MRYRRITGPALLVVFGLGLSGCETSDIMDKAQRRSAISIRSERRSNHCPGKGVPYSRKVFQALSKACRRK